MKRHLTIGGALLLATALLWPSELAWTQAKGGNASLSVSVSSARVALPANTQAYPSIIIAPAPGTTQEIFYEIGNASVTAALTSASLPTGGICVNVGPSTNVAAIVGSGTATVRITQLTTCAAFSGGGSAGGTIGSVTPYSFTPSTGADQHNLAITTSTALTVPADALFAQVCAAGANVNFTWTGTAPTASVGQPLGQGQCEFFSGRAVLTALLFIQKSATATLDVTYSK